MTKDMITNPCGECCELCGYYYDGGCNGCRGNKAEKCEIAVCCTEHCADDCSACYEFPCERLKAQYAKWHKELPEQERTN